jgi:hypothetical protein
MKNRSSERPRPLPFRFLAILMMAVFFLAGAREGLAGYVCQQHEGHDHSAASHAGNEGHDAHAAHGAVDHGDAESATAADASDPPQAEPCSCVGDCKTGETGARSDAGQVASETTDSTASPVTLASVGPLPGAPKFLLPYSNGPPQLV